MTVPYELPEPTLEEVVAEDATRWAMMPNPLRRLVMKLNTLERLEELGAPDPLIATQKESVRRGISEAAAYLIALEDRCSS